MGQHRGQWEQTQRVPTGLQEILFHLKGNGALELAQRAYRVSILGDTAKLSGQGTGQLAPGVPVWAGWLDQ